MKAYNNQSHWNGPAGGPVLCTVMARSFLIALVALLMALPSNGRALEYNKGWFECRSATDCDIAFNYCGEPEGVNAQFRSKAQIYFDQTPYHCRAVEKPKAGDTEWDAWIADVRASLRCDDSRCVVPEEKKYRKSKDELIDLLGHKKSRNTDAIQ